MCRDWKMTRGKKVSVKFTKTLDVSRPLSVATAKEEEEGEVEIKQKQKQIK